jgi:predicted ATP-grasp superfamily ATP-dependent carboligase
MNLPGFRTRQAHVIQIPEVNGEKVIESLIAIRGHWAATQKPVLYLTNDNMVRIVGENWNKLQHIYQLSWAQSQKIIVQLLDKSRCEHYLRSRGYPLPATWLIDNKTVETQLGSIEFPVIVKPSRPLGEFKALKLDTKGDLTALIEKYPGTPLIVQEWIPGGDDKIFFCATVARHGEPICFFDGVKYLSHPPARGQTVVAGPSKRRELRELVTRLTRETRMSGPMSIEAKLDTSGSFKIIEPTVGRTDFWAKLAIVNGVDLPYCEYLSVVAPTQAYKENVPRIPRIWFDTEKDPASFPRLLRKISIATKKPWLPSFTYLDARDRGPYWRALGRFAERASRFVRKKLKSRIN